MDADGAYRCSIVVCFIRATRRKNGAGERKCVGIQKGYFVDEWDESDAVFYKDAVYVVGEKVLWVSGQRFSGHQFKRVYVAEGWSRILVVEILRCKTVFGKQRGKVEDVDCRHLGCVYDKVKSVLQSGGGHSNFFELRKVWNSAGEQVGGGNVVLVGAKDVVGQMDAVEIGEREGQVFGLEDRVNVCEGFKGKGFGVEDKKALVGVGEFCGDAFEGFEEKEREMEDVELIVLVGVWGRYLRDEDRGAVAGDGKPFMDVEGRGKFVRDGRVFLGAMDL